MLGSRRGSVSAGQWYGKVNRGDDLVKGHVIQMAPSLPSHLTNLGVEGVGEWGDEDVINSAVVFEGAFLVAVEGVCSCKRVGGMKVELGAHRDVMLVCVGNGVCRSI